MGAGGAQMTLSERSGNVLIYESSPAALNVPTKIGADGSIDRCQVAPTPRRMSSISDDSKNARSTWQKEGTAIL